MFLRCFESCDGICHVDAMSLVQDSVKVAFDHFKAAQISMVDQACNLSAFALEEILLYRAQKSPHSSNVRAGNS